MSPPRQNTQSKYGDCSLFGLIACLGLASCDGASQSPAAVGGSVPFPAPLSAMAQLGEKIFRDTTLSASGRESCQTCHDPSSGHAAPPDSGAVPLGGIAMDRRGFRNAPSLRYLAQNPVFFYDSEGTPTGGFDRDGRADTLAQQAHRPFLAPHEMANATASDVIQKLGHAAYASEFQALFGADIFATPDAAFDRMALALQRYQQEDLADFAPFTSKYDAFLDGHAALTDAELRGLALYNDPTRGNCAGCHPSGRGPNGAPPLFTDFTYDNLGVPRNPDIPANADPDYFDLGICGPDRADVAGIRPDLCGAFKVPTLRNIALTAPYFHNGRFATLREVLRFYVRRDTNPEQFYPPDSSGQPMKFNDLPDLYKANVNTTEVPYNRHPGDQPALDAAEIDDVIAFLNTLTDGYTP
jgi:cytochrome c peroxidase